MNLKGKIMRLVGFSWLFAPFLALALVGCDVDVQDPGTMPDADVEVDRGTAPDVDVQGPNVDVQRERRNVTVPDVDVDVQGEEKEVTVPNVDVSPPDENANE